MRSPYLVACVSMESLVVTDRLVVHGWSAARTCGGGRVIEMQARLAAHAAPRALPSLREPGAAATSLLNSDTDPLSPDGIAAAGR